MIIKLGILGTSKHYKQRIHFGLQQAFLQEQAGDMAIEPYAIASRNQEKANAMASDLGIKCAYGSYEELLDDDQITMVYIPLPNNMHLEYIKKAADAGKSILCEKPLTLNAQETQEAFAYAGSKNVMLMEAFMYPFAQQWQVVKRIIDQGEIGAVRLINGIFTYDNPDPNNIRNQESLGGGALYDIGCYPISVARFLLGRKPKRVMSLLDTHKDFKVDCFSSAVLDFGDARASFTVGTNVYASQSIHILGSSGEIVVPLPFNAYKDCPLEITVSTKIGTRTVVLPCDDQYVNEFYSFARSVSTGTANLYTKEMSIDNAHVLDAVFASQQSQSWVDIT